MAKKATKFVWSRLWQIIFDNAQNGLEKKRIWLVQYL